MAMRFHREHPMINCCSEIFPSDSPAESFAEWIAQQSLGAVLKTLHIVFETLHILFDLTSILLGFVHIQGFDIISRLAGVRLELSDCAFYGPRRWRCGRLASLTTGRHSLGPHGRLKYQGSLILNAMA